MELNEINNNEFELDTDNNDVVLNSLNIALKSYFSSYKSIREKFDKRTYEDSHTRDYYENFSETILHFHHFFELTLKNLLRNENKLLPLVLSDNTELVVKLIQNTPISDEEYKTLKSLSFSQLLDRVCKLIKLKPEVNFKFIKEFENELKELNRLRNKIWHQGKVMLKYNAFDFFIGKHILPIVLMCLDVSEYREKYRSRQIWKFNKNSLKINPLQALLEEFQNESPAIDKIAVLKELGRASYYSHYDKGFGSYIDNKNKSANELAQAELESIFTNTNGILKCPCCGALSLVTYKKDIITDFNEQEYEDENGNIRIFRQEEGYQCIYMVKCANCSFQLNKNGIKNLKEYGLNIEDYWLKLD
ncbi:hypothetical protein [Mammaliicoccus sp. N-M50]|uniref:hypothetical protein n=1 Tax=Mammaliicoccus sp. N-M50 TaxID=2898709 RepID=UPI001EFB2FC8|nr:hypothetical protein [Mammaliicoccus sp. N-M50]